MYYRSRGSLNPSTDSFRRVELAREREVKIVHAVSQNWNLDLVVYTLQDLKHALTARLAEIGRIGRKKERADDVEIPEYFDMHFLNSASFAIELFNDEVGEPRGKWVLLFDELELAPTWVSMILMDSLRGFNDNIVF